MFGFTSSSSAANLNGTPTRVDAGAGRLEPLRLGALHAEPVQLAHQRPARRRRRCRRGCAAAPPSAVTFTASAHHLLREVAVAAVSLRQRAHVGGRVVADLAAEHLVLLTAADRDRRRRADVRLRRHRRHVRGLGDVQRPRSRRGRRSGTRRRPPASARARMSFTMSRIESSSPPGVSRRKITMSAPSLSASSSACSTHPAEAGLIVMSSSTDRTSGPPSCCAAPVPAAGPARRGRRRATLQPMRASHAHCPLARAPAMAYSRMSSSSAASEA